MRVSVDQDYDFNFSETNQGRFEEDHVAQRVTSELLMSLCNVEHAALIILTPTKCYIKADSKVGCATPAMIQLCILAQKLFGMSEDALITHLRNTILVVRQPGSHNAFHTPDENIVLNRGLKEALSQNNALQMSIDLNCHVVLIAQYYDGTMESYSQFFLPTYFNARMQLVFAIAKSIENTAAGVIASIVPHLQDTVIIDQVARAVDSQ